MVDSAGARSCFVRSVSAGAGRGLRYVYTAVNLPGTRSGITRSGFIGLRGIGRSSAWQARLQLPVAGDMAANAGTAEPGCSQGRAVTVDECGMSSRYW